METRRRSKSVLSTVIRLGLAAASLAGLANPVSAAEHRMAAGSIRMHNVLITYREGHCDTFPVATLPLSGLPGTSPAVLEYRSRPEFGTLMVGFENAKQKGADPLPCNTWMLDAVQIGVKFNLAAVEQAVRDGERIQSAFLSWQARDDSMAHIPDRLEVRPFRACRDEGFVAGNANRAFASGYTERIIRSRDASRRSILLGFANRTRSRNVREEQGNDGGPVRHEMNVTRIVNAWFAPSALPNHGIIMSPPSGLMLTETVDESSLNTGSFRTHHCWRMLKNIRLRVVTGR